MLVLQLPLIPWEVWPGLLTGLGALVAALAGWPKVLAELKKFREKADSTDEKVASIDHEMRPNSGGSMRDSLDRIEVAISKLDGDVERLGRASLRHDAELGRINDAVLQLRGITDKAIGRVHRRLDDHSLRLRAMEAQHPQLAAGATPERTSNG